MVGEVIFGNDAEALVTTIQNCCKPNLQASTARPTNGTGQPKYGSGDRVPATRRAGSAFSLWVGLVDERTAALEIWPKL